MFLNLGKFYGTVVILSMILLVYCKKAKIVKCHVCSNQENLECDFIHNRDPKFLKICPDVRNEETGVNKSAKCVVERDFSTKFPTVSRKCGPVPCADGMICCECTKTGCNGDNKCKMVFNASTIHGLSKFLIIFLFCNLLHFTVAVFF